MFKNAQVLTPEAVKNLELLNRPVLITTNRNAKYLGTLVRVGKEKFTLQGVHGLQKCGTYKFGCKRIARDFNYSSTIKMESAENYVEPKYEFLGRPVSREEVGNV